MRENKILTVERGQERRERKTKCFNKLRRLLTNLSNYYNAKTKLLVLTTLTQRYITRYKQGRASKAGGTRVTPSDYT
jgi:RNase adaptor protein for sRNA GlmZ degradation